MLTRDDLARLPTNEQWLAQMPAVRVAAVLLTKSEQDLQRLAPDLMHVPEVFISLAEQLEVLAGLLRVAEARLIEASSPKS
jgi:hypothetical protein